MGHVSVPDNHLSSSAFSKITPSWDTIGSSGVNPEIEHKSVIGSKKKSRDGSGSSMENPAQSPGLTMGQNLDVQLKAMIKQIADHTADQFADRSVFEDVNYVTFGLTFLGALVLILGAWAIFEILARHPTTRPFMRQRLFHPKCIALTRSGEDHRDVPPDVKSWNSILFGAFTIPNEKLPGLMGPGGHLTHRLIRQCAIFGHLSLVYVFTVLMPLYFCQFYHKYNVDVDLLKMTSITYVSPLNPSHIWVVVISAYIGCIYWVLVIYTEWQHVKAVRLSWEHDSRSYDVQSHYSLLVERTQNTRKMTELKVHLARLLGKDESEIAYVMPVYYNSRLDSLYTRRFWASMAPGLCLGGDKKDVLASYAAQIDYERRRFRQDILEPTGSNALMSLQTRGARPFSTSTQHSWSLADENLPDAALSQITVKTVRSLGTSLKQLFYANHSPAYFVTLLTMRSRTVLAHMYSSQGDTFARISPAPAPRDIVWSNVTIDRSLIATRRFFVHALLAVFVVTYSIPLNMLLDIARKYRRQNWTAAVDEGIDEDEKLENGFKELVYLFFPAIIQTIISQMIPRLLRVVSRSYERFKTFTEITQHVMQRTYMLQLLTIYIIVFGELWFDVRNLDKGFMSFLDSTLVGFKKLGRAMPPVALYFCSAITINLVTQIAHPLVQPVDLIITLWNRYVSGNVNAWRDCELRQMRYTGDMITYLTLLNTMLTFAVISPVVVLFCWIFWSLSYLWNTYALIYLNNRRTEIGTAYSSNMFSAISFSLILSQLSLYFVIWSYSRAVFEKRAHPQLYVVFALVIALIIFKYSIMRNFTFQSNRFTSLSISADMDNMHKPEEMSALFSPEYYLQPDAKLDDDASKDTLAEVPEDISQRTSDSETAHLIEKSIS